MLFGPLDGCWNTVRRRGDQFLEDGRVQVPGGIERFGRPARLGDFGQRGGAQTDALVDALVRLSQLAADLGDLVVALDVNPLMVLPKGQGVRAVDALVEIAALRSEAKAYDC